MKILLDECVPWPVRKLLPGHDCQSVPRRGWAGIHNGDLLRLAETEFDLFITSDQGIAYQQNLKGRSIAILQLPTNKLRQLEAAANKIRAAVDSMAPAGFVALTID